MIGVWLARLLLLVSIVFLRTGDAFRAIERFSHRRSNAIAFWLHSWRLSFLVAAVDWIEACVRGVCGAGTVKAYRWCNWWRQRSIVRAEERAPETATAPVANVKGIGAAWAATKQR